MAIPDNRLSVTPVRGAYIAPYNRAPVPLVSYSIGGTAVENPNDGLQVQEWRLDYGGSPAQFVVTPLSIGSPTSVLTRDDVTDCSLAFDQLMRVVLAWRQTDGNVYLRWYDSVVAGQVITNFGPGETPRCLLDDSRPLQTVAGTSDVLFFYVRAGALYYRQQRDRYAIERNLVTFQNPTAVIYSYGQTVRNRIEFEVRVP